MWGEWGIFVAAHEYGHAVHEKALDGNEGSGQCPSSRRIDEYTNVSCAFSEGFANYHAVAVRPDLPSYWYRSKIAVNAFFPGCTTYSGSTCVLRTSDDYDGAKIEGAVAAFFYDVTDPAGTETHDEVEAPGSYMRDIIKTCQVLALNWRRANGVDHLVYCMEHVITSRPEFRNVHDQQESAQESASWGWSPANMRALWEGNLFDKR